MIIKNLSALRFGRDYEAIFFDFDGVLADSEPVHYSCWRDVLAGRGIDLTWDYYEKDCIGVSDRAMLMRLGMLADPPQPADELFSLYPLKKKLFREACAARSPVSPQTCRAVEALKTVPLAVVTSSGRSEVEPILLHSWPVQPFRCVVVGSDVKNLKPSPEPYRLAAERCQVGRALVFEDSGAGVQSADAAGHLVFRLSRPEDLARSLQTLVL